MDDMISIYRPQVTKYTDSAIRAIASGWISNHGEYVTLATSKLSSIVHSKFSILMSNGTCATHCLFLALKFKYPDINKIYVPSNAFVAAWNSVLMVYDISCIQPMKMDQQTWNISTEDEYILSIDRNSAVLIVHNLGNIINVPKLKRMRPDLVFVEDNCEGMFGKYEDTFAGMSDATLCSSCSFYGNKIITTGEGGAFFTQDIEIYEYIKSVHSHGMSNTKYLHTMHAYNYRMTNVQAAFLYDQLCDIDEILGNKCTLFSTYDSLLEKLVQQNKVSLIKRSEDTKRSPWMYSLRILNNSFTVEETTNFFLTHRVDIRPYFYPIDCHNHLNAVINTDDTSYLLNKEVIMIPSSPSITFEEQKHVVSVVEIFIGCMEAH